MAKKENWYVASDATGIIPTPFSSLKDAQEFVNSPVKFHRGLGLYVAKKSGIHDSERFIGKLSLLKFYGYSMMDLGEE